LVPKGKGTKKAFNHWKPAGRKPGLELNPLGFHWLNFPGICLFLVFHKKGLDWGRNWDLEGGKPKGALGTFGKGLWFSNSFPEKGKVGGNLISGRGQKKGDLALDFL